MKIRTAGLVAVCALLGAPAGAQDRLGPPKDPAKLERPSEQVASMKAALEQVLGRADEARSQKDVVKLNCVNEKLAQMRSLLKIAEQADVAVEHAIATRAPGADAELSKIGIARTKVEALRSEAQQCIGRLAYVIDERTTVEVQQPEGVAGPGVTTRRPPGVPPVAPPVVRPPPASRFY